MFPGYWIRIDHSVRYEPEMTPNAAHFVLITIDKLKEDFEAETLTDAMNLVREWKDKQ